MFADTHCHLDFSELAQQLALLKVGMEEKKIGLLVVPAVERNNWSKVMKICSRDSRFFFGLGLHPYFIDRHKEEDLIVLAETVGDLKKEKVDKLVAVGEIGLDFTRPDAGKQISLFEGQLALAESHKLPVIIHTRKAHSETLASLKKYQLVGGVIHAFSGSFELMMSYVELGLKIGVGPVITWPSSVKSRKSFMMAPIESLVLETDAPDMAVTNVLSGSGSPLDVCHVFAELAKIRNETKQQLEQALWENSKQLFNR